MARREGDDHRRQCFTDGLGKSRTARQGPAEGANCPAYWVDIAAEGESVVLEEAKTLSTEPRTLDNLLHGKVILVTGAARSIGAAICDHAQRCGATVIRTDVDPGGGVLQLDVRSRADWERVAGEIFAQHGRIDGLVNNAAVYFGLKPMWDETDAEFEQLLAVNVMGSWLGIQVVSRIMAQSGGGSIVNLSSTSGLMGAPDVAGYGVTRWATRGMAKHAAVFLADRNIRANSVHPHRVVGTGMVMPTTPDRELEIQQAVPLRRGGTVDDVSATVAFLLSDQSSFITGREFVIDGGSTLRVAQ